MKYSEEEHSLSKIFDITKIWKKSNILKKSKTYILHVDNAEKLLKNFKKKLSYK